MNEGVTDRDNHAVAWAALSELLCRLGRGTGKAVLNLDVNQGGITNARISFEEVFKPKT
jgi:hypothetical protein